MYLRPLKLGNGLHDNFVVIIHVYNNHAFCRCIGPHLCSVDTLTKIECRRL